MTKKLFISNYVGLASRFETLAMAFMIKDYFGHEIILDWPDLDDFNVLETKKGKLWPQYRLNWFKILNYKHPNDFLRLQQKKYLSLRTQYGPPDYLLNKYYLSSYRKIKLNPNHIINIIDFFKQAEHRPIVGVHIRRGDFILEGEDSYNATRQESLSVPTWWYVHVMNEIKKREPNVSFFVSYTGSESDYPEIFDNFDCLTYEPHFQYSDNSKGHYSEKHAVIDLFALACCKMIIASPCSSFSHVAVNALGSESIAILPKNKMNKKKPEYGMMSLWGRQARNIWYDSCRSNENWELIISAKDLPDLSQPDLSWF